MDIDVALKAAADWRDKGRLDREAIVRETALSSMALEAVRMEETAGCDWLVHRGAPSELQRMGVLAQQQANETGLEMVDLANVLGLFDLSRRGAMGRHSIDAVDRAFMKRNSDRRCIDPVGLDGDGELPVKWDFRKRSLLMAAEASR